MLTHGQTNDFLTYMSGGTVALWCLGALSAPLALTVVGLCGAGAIAHRRSQDQGIIHQRQNIDQVVESKLRADYGERAVAVYRMQRTKLPPQLAAREAIFNELQHNYRGN